MTACCLISSLRQIWNGLDDDDYGDVIKLALLTAQRRAEIGDIRWSEIDLDRALLVLPAARTKNKRPHIVPLSAPALAILRKRHRGQRDLIFGHEALGFTSWSSFKAGLDSRVKIGPWRVHDLRRTAATRMADLGVLPHIIEQILNHASGHKSGVSGTYNRSHYETETRAALDLWAKHVMAITEA